MACGGQESQNYQDCLTFSSGEWTQSHTLLSRRHVGTNSIRDVNRISLIFTVPGEGPYEGFFLAESANYQALPNC